MMVKRVKASGNGETELHDHPRSGHPATTTSPDILQGADDIIHADRCITSRQRQYISQSSIEMQLIQHVNARPHTSL
jgi:hypothetical protein